MVEFYRSSFPRLTAVLYTGGAALHFMRVVTGFSPTDIPYFIDWVFTLPASLAPIFLSCIRAGNSLTRSQFRGAGATLEWLV